MAKRFVDDLLETNPDQRLSAKEAIKHDWVVGEQKPHISVTIKTKPISDYNSMQKVIVNFYIKLGFSGSMAIKPNCISFKYLDFLKKSF